MLYLLLDGTIPAYILRSLLHQHSLGLVLCLHRWLSRSFGGMSFCTVMTCSAIERSGMVGVWADLSQLNKTTSTVGLRFIKNGMLFVI